MMAPMRWRRGLALAALAAFAAPVAAGCSWRLDTPPEPFRTPSPTTVLRDHVAASEAAVGAAAGGSTGPAAGAEAAAVPIRLAALGGVSPTSSPRPSENLDAAIKAAQDAARECLEGAEDDPLGGLCASILLSHSLILGPPVAPTWEATAFLEGPQVTPGADSHVSAEEVGELALEHDKLRALFEVIAARSKGAERTAALETSSVERSRVAALLAVPGVQNLTQPAYDVPGEAAAALPAQVALAQTYAALLVSAAPQDREWLLNSAYVAYEAAIASGLTLAQVPALPGAVEPSPSPTAS